MKLLIVTAEYPNAGHPFSGIFNERSAIALQQLCDHLQVLVPRPYAPTPLSFLNSRWLAYARSSKYEVRNGVTVYRPAIPIVPYFAGAFFLNQGAFFWCRQVACRLHRTIKFDAILAFGLSAAGGIAWRLGQYLGLPAAGWATGSDVRNVPSKGFYRAVSQTLRSLDIVFYQSEELRQTAAEILNVPLSVLAAKQHVVLPRGIPRAATASRTIRQKMRHELGIADEQVLVLSVGRISREKGAFELIEAVSLAANRNPKVSCVMLGSNRAFDETTSVEREMNRSLGATHAVKIIPACHPDKVRDYLCAADIFAFTSHHEGMPNSLLEAMAMRVPAVAFAIPPVLEIERGTGGLITIPPFDVAAFADALVRLSLSPEERKRVGDIGQGVVKERFMVERNMRLALERLSQVIAHSTVLPRDVLAACENLRE